MSRRKAHRALGQFPMMVYKNKKGEWIERFSCCDFYHELDLSRPRIYEPLHKRWGIKTAELPLVRLELEVMVATQKYLRPESIRWHIDNPPPEKTPIVFKFRGKMYVHNGHHRFVARKLRGKRTVKARFADLDTMTQLAIVPKRFPREAEMKEAVGAKA